MSKHTEFIAFFIRQKLQLPALYIRTAALLLLALLLLRHRISALPVVDANQRVVGIVKTASLEHLPLDCSDH